MESNTIVQEQAIPEIIQTFLFYFGIKQIESVEATHRSIKYKISFYESLIEKKQDDIYIIKLQSLKLLEAAFFTIDDTIVDYSYLEDKDEVNEMNNCRTYIILKISNFLYSQETEKNITTFQNFLYSVALELYTRDEKNDNSHFYFLSFIIKLNIEDDYMHYSQLLQIFYLIQNPYNFSNLILYRYNIPEKIKKFIGFRIYSFEIHYLTACKEYILFYGKIIDIIINKLTSIEFTIFDTFNDKHTFLRIILTLIYCLNEKQSMRENINLDDKETQTEEEQKLKNSELIEEEKTLEKDDEKKKFPTIEPKTNNDNTNIKQESSIKLEEEILMKKASNQSDEISQLIQLFNDKIDSMKNQLKQEFNDKMELREKQLKQEFNDKMELREKQLKQQFNDKLNKIRQEYNDKMDSMKKQMKQQFNDKINYMQSKNSIENQALKKIKEELELELNLISKRDYIKIIIILCNIVNKLPKNQKKEIFRTNNTCNYKELFNSFRVQLNTIAHTVNDENDIPGLNENNKKCETLIKNLKKYNYNDTKVLDDLIPFENAINKNNLCNLILNITIDNPYAEFIINSLVQEVLNKKSNEEIEAKFNSLMSQYPNPFNDEIY